MTRAILAEPIITKQWWKNRNGEAVRVRLSTYEGHNLADIRTWCAAGGKLLPGKGFAAEVRHLPRLAMAVTKAVAKATELGLNAGKDNDDCGR